MSMQPQNFHSPASPASPEYDPRNTTRNALRCSTHDGNILYVGSQVCWKPCIYPAMHAEESTAVGYDTIHTEGRPLRLRSYTHLLGASSFRYSGSELQYRARWRDGTKWPFDAPRPDDPQNIILAATTVLGGVACVHSNALHTYTPRHEARSCRSFSNVNSPHSIHSSTPRLSWPPLSMSPQYELPIPEAKALRPPRRRPSATSPPHTDLNAIIMSETYLPVSHVNHHHLLLLARQPNHLTPSPATHSPPRLDFPPHTDHHPSRDCNSGPSPTKVPAVAVVQQLSAGLISPVRDPERVLDTTCALSFRGRGQGRQRMVQREGGRRVSMT